jgi:addiction module HigA family antidote
MFKNGMRPVHPGEILREDYLIPLGMSANALAKALSVPAPRVNDIVRERRGSCTLDAKLMRVTAGLVLAASILESSGLTYNQLAEKELKYGI